jgi:hypothetical protein
MNFDNIDRLFDHIEHLERCHKKQAELMDELRKSIIHKCGESLDHPKARTFFIAAKEKELTATRIKLNAKGEARSFESAKFGLDACMRAESIFRQIQFARCIEEHGGCDINEYDNCNRCHNPRTMKWPSRTPPEPKDPPPIESSSATS